MHNVSDFFHKTAISFHYTQLPRQKIVINTNDEGLLRDNAIRLLKRDEIKLRCEAIAWSLIPIAIVALATSSPYILGALKITGTITLIVDLSLGLISFVNSSLFTRMRSCWRKANQTKLLKKDLQLSDKPFIDIKAVVPKLTLRQTRLIFGQLNSKQYSDFMMAATPIQAKNIIRHLKPEDLENCKSFLRQAIDKINRFLNNKNNHHNYHIINLYLSHLNYWSRSLNYKYLAEIRNLAITCQEKLRIEYIKNKKSIAPINLKLLASDLKLASVESLFKELNRYNLTLNMIENCGFGNILKVEKNKITSVPELKEAVVFTSIKRMLGDALARQWLESHYDISSLATVNAKKILEEAAVFGLNQFFNKKDKIKEYERRFKEIGIELSDVIEQAIINKGLFKEKWCKTLSDLKNCIITYYLLNKFSEDNRYDLNEILQIFEIKDWETLAETDFANIKKM